MFRKSLIDILSAGPRTVSSIARELGLEKRDVAGDLQHALRTARASGRTITVTPARCRSCGFTFGDHKLVKPGKCPECRGTRLFEAMIEIA